MLNPLDTKSINSYIVSRIHEDIGISLYPMINYSKKHATTNSKTEDNLSYSHEDKQVIEFWSKRTTRSNLWNSNKYCEFLTMLDFYFDWDGKTLIPRHFSVALDSNELTIEINKMAPYLIIAHVLFPNRIMDIYCSNDRTLTIFKDKEPLFHYVGNNKKYNFIFALRPEHGNIWETFNIKYKVLIELKKLGIDYDEFSDLNALLSTLEMIVI